MFDKKICVAGSLALATFIYVLWGPTKKRSKKRGLNQFVMIFPLALGQQFSNTSREVSGQLGT